MLAAGEGRRLRPLTDRTPKPLLQVGATTPLDLALRRVETVVRLSPETVAVNAHHLADQVVAHVAGRAHVSVEQPVALGTAGAVGAIHDWLAGRDVLVANGDAVFVGDPDLPGLVGGWDGDRPRLLVVEDLDRPDFEGRWRFAGVSLLPATMAAALPATPLGLYEAVWRSTPLDLAPREVRFIDCGTPEDYALVRRLAADPDPAGGSLR